VSRESNSVRSRPASGIPCGIAAIIIIVITTARTGCVFAGDPRQKKGRRVMVHVEERHVIVLLPQNEDDGVRELGDLED